MKSPFGEHLPPDLGAGRLGGWEMGPFSATVNDRKTMRKEGFPCLVNTEFERLVSNRPGIISRLMNGEIKSRQIA